MYQQQQPVYYQQPVQQQMGQPMMGQPMMMQPGQPMMQPVGMGQPLYGVQPVQPIIQPIMQVAQPMMQPILQVSAVIPTAMTPSQPGQPSHDQIQKLLTDLKDANSMTVKYQDKNFREGGDLRFQIFGRDPGNPVAFCYTYKNGDIKIEVPDPNQANAQNSFEVIGLKSNSATIYNPQTGQKELFGTVAWSDGCLGGFQIPGEKNGNRDVIFQNNQFSFLLCCCCSLFYLLHYKCCNDENKLWIVNKDGDQLGNAQYRTDEMKSFRELDITMQGSGDLHSRAFVALQSVIYMCTRVKVKSS